MKTRKHADEYKGVKGVENNTNVLHQLAKDQKNNAATDKEKSNTSVSIKQDEKKFERNNGSINNFNGDESIINEPKIPESIKNNKTKDNKKLITDTNDINNNTSKKANNETSAINVKNEKVQNNEGGSKGYYQGGRKNQVNKENDTELHTGVNEPSNQTSLKNELDEENIINKPGNQGYLEKKIKQEKQAIESENLFQGNGGMEFSKTEANKYKNKSKEQSTKNEQNGKNQTIHRNTRKNNDFKMVRYYKLMRENDLENNIPNEELETDGDMKDYETSLNGKKQYFNNMEDAKSEEQGQKAAENKDNSFDHFKDYPEHFNKDENTKVFIEILKGKKEGTIMDINKKLVDINEKGVIECKNDLENEKCDKNTNNNAEKDKRS
ncbi:probable serine/threonine-protein kinase DDB_G0283337 [Hyposmocoma kahamanoa]|uniref:probable serine/threonine-protein kinase DDB_G0283337 n=1 Tax=Hyposmocoma kahamanoa TaxID=1477025 RepID=UPI000E6D7097|nr:probable serine/threonine-protein kinase DDB_G0283337 [Hyposmocoma kahamanoa]